MSTSKCVCITNPFSSHDLECTTPDGITVNISPKASKYISDDEQTPYTYIDIRILTSIKEICIYIDGPNISSKYFKINTQHEDTLYFDNHDNCLGAGLCVFPENSILYKEGDIIESKEPVVYNIFSEGKVHSCIVGDTIACQSITSDVKYRAMLKDISLRTLKGDAKDKSMIMNYSDSLKLKTSIKCNINPSVRFNTKNNLYTYPVSNNSIVSISEDISLKMFDRIDVCYIMNLRHVNFTHTGGAHYRTLASDPFVMTYNVITLLGEDLTILDEILVEELKDKVYPQAYVKGIEDLRLFFFQGDLCGLGSSQEYHPQGCQKMVLVYFPSRMIGMSIKPDAVVPLVYDNSNTEKNWLGCEDHMSKNMVIMYTPFKLGYLKGNRIQSLSDIISKDFQKNYQRGSAGPIHFLSGYLSMTHEVHMDTFQKRVYLHRFIYYFDDMSPALVSKHFYLYKIGVEYVTGIASNPEGNVLISFSVDDEMSYILECKCDVIINELDIPVGIGRNNRIE